VEAGDFADELELGGADFLGSDRRIKVEERSDVSAHDGKKVAELRRSGE